MLLDRSLTFTGAPDCGRDECYGNEIVDLN
jgi:hypothetical protein